MSPSSSSFILFVSDVLHWCWANAKDIPTPADWCCCWLDKDTTHPLLLAPWLLEVGEEEEGRRGKSWHAVLNADAALFRWMEGVGGQSGEENPAECLENGTWQRLVVVVVFFFFFSISYLKLLTRAGSLKSVVTLFHQFATSLSLSISLCPLPLALWFVSGL